MNNLNLQKLYYYIICLIAVFILIWGMIDTVSAGASYFLAPSQNISSSSPPQSGDEEKNLQSQDGGQMLEDYYRGRVASERMGDSLTRLIISGIVFLYSRKKINKLEA